MLIVSCHEAGVRLSSVVHEAGFDGVPVVSIT